MGYAVPYAAIAAVSAAVFFLLYPFAAYMRDAKGNYWFTKIA